MGRGHCCCGVLGVDHLFKSTLPSVLIFTMIYAAIRVALVVLRKGNDE
jgi:hypothetical protein